jgi:hypothetical protein
MQPRAVPAPALNGLAVAVLPRHNQAARYELMLNLETNADGALEGPLTYATSLFDGSTIAGWIERLRAFLRDAPRCWDAPLDRSPIGKTGAESPAHTEDMSVLGSTGSPHTASAMASCAEPACVSSQRPEPGSVSPGSPFATATERALAEIWAEFLQAAPSSRDDDFFVLGGHSLLLMRVIHRLTRSGLGRLELADALGATRLAEMAAAIECAPAPEEHPTTTGVTNATRPRRDPRDSPARAADPGRQPGVHLRDGEGVASQPAMVLPVTRTAAGVE